MALGAHPLYCLDGPKVDGCHGGINQHRPRPAFAAAARRHARQLRWLALLGQAVAIFVTYSGSGFRFRLSLSPRNRGFGLA